MSKNYFQAYLAGHRDVIADWPRKALAAGVLIQVGRARSGEDLDSRRDSSSLFIGRGNLALLAFVTEGGEGSLWQPQGPNEWALCVAAKTDLADGQIIQARHAVFDLVRAFPSETVTLLMLVEETDDSISLREFPVGKP